MKTKYRSLISLLTHRLLWIAGVVVVLNWVIITVHYTSDRAELDGQVLASQLALLDQHFDGEIGEVSAETKAFYEQHANSYAYAIVGPNGNFVDSKNSELIPRMALGAAMLSEDWSTHVPLNGQSILVGSRLLSDRGDGTRVMFAMADDPARLKTKALVLELAMHVWLPILPMAIVLIGSNAVMIRHSLKPISVAAQWAKSLKPNQPIPPLPDVQLPTEVMDLVDASQRSLQQLNMALSHEKRQAAEMAHALRTPLAVLVARLDALTPSQETDKLKQEVNQLSKTVSQVLAASRADGLTLQESSSVDLVKVSQTVLAKYASDAHRQGIELSLTTEAPAILAKADEDAVSLALSNLIENALLHAGQGGVEVSVHSDASIRVRDHGKGLPPGDPDDLFESFVRGKNASEGGSGLGLAIVKRLQRAQGGSVSARNMEPPGAEFTLHFQALEA